MSEEVETTRALAVVEQGPTALTSWEGAVARGLLARTVRQEIINRVLIPEDDFGKIPGVDRPVLKKSGAEKIADALELYPEYEAVSSIEEWQAPVPFFFYRYRCILRQRQTGLVVATGIGSCNSKESKYRWRNQERKCPQCGQPTILRSKHEPEWFCWAKKGGCGAKFPFASAVGAAIEGQEVGRIENEDTASIVNTIDKMAQKRAIVAASLNLGFSANFTQDLEDVAPGADEPVGNGGEKPEPAKRAPRARSAPNQPAPPPAEAQAPPASPAPASPPTPAARTQPKKVETIEAKIVEGMLDRMEPRSGTYPDGKSWTGARIILETESGSRWDGAVFNDDKMLEAARMWAHALVRVQYVTTPRGNRITGIELAEAEDNLPFGPEDPGGAEPPGGWQGAR